MKQKSLVCLLFILTCSIQSLAKIETPTPKKMAATLNADPFYAINGGFRTSFELKLLKRLSIFFPVNIKLPYSTVPKLFDNYFLLGTGAGVKFSIDGDVLATGWYAKADIGLNYANWPKQFSGSYFVFNSKATFGHAWFFDNGLNIQAGLGLHYTLASGSKVNPAPEKITSLMPASDLIVGYAF